MNCFKALNRNQKRKFSGFLGGRRFVTLQFKEYDLFITGLELENELRVENQKHNFFYYFSTTNYKSSFNSNRSKSLTFAIINLQIKR